jgi:hypothetical protein
MWWYMPIISALRRLRQEDCKLVGYVASSYLKKKKKLFTNLYYIISFM